MFFLGPRSYNSDNFTAIRLGGAKAGTDGSDYAASRHVRSTVRERARGFGAPERAGKDSD